MRLRNNVTISSALKSLEELSLQASNIVTDQIPDSYLIWVENAEIQLRNLFMDGFLADDLISQRYFYIRQIVPRSGQPRPWQLVQAERDLQKNRIDQVISNIKNLNKLKEVEGTPLILDTHVFLHFNSFKTIDWLKEFGLESARLIIPLVVLDQLDDKTFSPNRKLAKRADKVLRDLDEYIVNADASRTQIQSKVTLEVLVDDLSHRRKSNEDSIIIEQATFLNQILDKKVILVTGDRGMRVRSYPQGIELKFLPNALRLLLDEGDA